MSPIQNRQLTKPALRLKDAAVKLSLILGEIVKTSLPPVKNRKAGVGMFFLLKNGVCNAEPENQDPPQGL